MWGDAGIEYVDQVTIASGFVISQQSIGVASTVVSILTVNLQAVLLILLFFSLVNPTSGTLTVSWGKSPLYAATETNTNTHPPLGLVP